MTSPAIKLVLAIALSISAATTNAMTLTDLLIEKGVISQSEASSLSDQGPVAQSSLVALLVGKGVITTAEANALAVASPAPAPAPAAVPAVTTEVAPFVVKAKDKAVQSLTISGRIQGQWDLLATDYEDASDPNSENNLFMRRMYLGVGAQFTDNLSGIINMDIANGASGTAEIEKALIEYDFSGNHTLSAGFKKVPFGYEENTSSSKMKAVERSVANRYYVEDFGARHTGLYLTGAYDSGIYFEVAVTNPIGNSVSASSGTDSLAYWGQIGWEGDLGTGSIDTGFGAGHIPDARQEGLTDMVWNLYANYTLGDFSLLGEILSGTADSAGPDGKDAKPFNFAILPAYRINDQFEIVGRYSQIDADNGLGADISRVFRRAPENGSATYNDVKAYYIGGNWYIMGNTFKVSAGYEWASFENNLTGTQGDADAEGFRTRMQLLF